MNSNLDDEFSDEEERDESDEEIREREEKYVREVDLQTAAMAKALSELSKTPREVQKRRPLNPLLAIIAAEEKRVAQLKADVEARIQAAVEEAIEKERALTNKTPSA